MTYDRKYIVKNFRGLIGLMASWDASNVKAKIDEDLSESASGVYVNNLHELFTPEIFSSTAQKFWGFQVRNWSSAASYPEGVVVKSGNVEYRSLQASNNNPPATSPDYWKETSLLSMWFRSKYDAAVLNVYDKLNERNKLENNGREFRSRSPLYTVEGTFSSTIPKSGRFVGFEIDLKLDNMAVQVQRIGLGLNQEATVPIHVRTDDGDEVLNLTFAGEGRVKYADVNMSAFLSGNGPAVVGYYEDDLGEASAIKFSNNVFSNEPCYSCGTIDSKYRTSWDQYIKVTPFSSINDVSTVDYNSNYGLNLVMSYRCDLSDLVIREKMSLISALRAQLTLDFLKEIAGNVRNNADADVTQIMAYNQLKDYEDPENPKIALDRAIKGLQWEFSGNSACLQCTKKTKIVNRVM